MRIIKFRAWDATPSLSALIDSESERMLSWVKLNEYDKDGIFCIMDILMGIEPHITPMQFTGIIDKNKKEVYEGDIIVRWENGEKETPDEIKEVVVWDDFYLTYTGVVVSGNNCEVIGNIYENKDIIP